MKYWFDNYKFTRRIPVSLFLPWFPSFPQFRRRLCRDYVKQRKQFKFLFALQFSFFVAFDKSDNREVTMRKKSSVAERK